MARIIEENQVEKGQREGTWFADASDLGWPVGSFPQHVILAGRALRLRSRDYVAARYIYAEEPDSATAVLTVFND